jgi:CRISPR/Cas system-associated endoribonuclease Cas2
MAAGTATKSKMQASSYRGEINHFTTLRQLQSGFQNLIFLHSTCDMRHIIIYDVVK